MLHVIVEGPNPNHQIRNILAYCYARATETVPAFNRNPFQWILDQPKRVRPFLAAAYEAQIPVFEAFLGRSSEVESPEKWGSYFPLREAREILRSMRFHKDDIVILTSGRIAQAFMTSSEYRNRIYLLPTEIEHCAAPVILSPSPSGVNSRFWTSPDNRAYVKKQIEELAAALT